MEYNNKVHDYTNTNDVMQCILYEAHCWGTGNELNLVLNSQTLLSS